MHNVRAYTFWFLQFYISAYTTLNELLAVFIYNICGFIKVWKVTEQLLCIHSNYYYYLPATSLQNFIYLRQSAAEILPFVQKSKTAAAAILNFIFVQYFGISVCRTFNIIHMPNFVQICAILNEFWTTDEIQNGGSRHLELIIFVHFGQMVYFRWQPATLLQNFIYLRQSAAEILLFVEKFKMAAAAILDLIFVQYFGLPACSTSRVIHMPNFVQICAIVNELWKINEIQNCARRHLEFRILSILIKRSVSGGSRLHHAKFHSSTSIGGRDIAVWGKNQDGGCRHLGFNYCLIFWHTCM